MPLIVLNSGAAQAYSYQENAMPLGAAMQGPYGRERRRRPAALPQTRRQIVTRTEPAVSGGDAVHDGVLESPCSSRSGEVWRRRPDTRPGRATRQGTQRPFEISRSDLGQRHRPQARLGAMSAALSQEPSYYFNTGLHAMPLGGLDQHLQRGNVSHCSRRIPAHAQPHGQSAASSATRIRTNRHAKDSTVCYIVRLRSHIKMMEITHPSSFTTK
jgi:hypothetical protein